jgi:glycopeptide antibiotics resistance protein
MLMELAVGGQQSGQSGGVMPEGPQLPLIALPLLLAVAIFRIDAGVPWRRAMLGVALADYVLFVTGMVLLPMGAQTGLGVGNGYLLADPGLWLNVVPLQTIGELLGRTSSNEAVRQIGGNLGLLVPLGFLLPALSPRLRRWRAFAVSAVSIAVGIEALQFLGRASGLVARSVDIDDVILNALGALLGFLLYRASIAFISHPDEEPVEDPGAIATGANRLPCPRVPRATHAWWTTQ